MPKMKTRKSVAKRVKVTATGKIMRHKARRRHLMSSKSAKRRRNLRKKAVVAAPDARRLRRMLGLA